MVVCRVCWFRHRRIMPAVWLIAADWPALNRAVGLQAWEFSGACTLHATVQEQAAVSMEVEQ